MVGTVEKPPYWSVVEVVFTLMPVVVMEYSGMVEMPVLGAG
jgi:hypothetical protein